MKWFFRTFRPEQLRELILVLLIFLPFGEVLIKRFFNFTGLFDDFFPDGMPTLPKQAHGTGIRCLAASSARCCNAPSALRRCCSKVPG